VKDSKYTKGIRLNSNVEGYQTPHVDDLGKYLGGTRIFTLIALFYVCTLSKLCSCCIFQWIE